LSNGSEPSWHNLDQEGCFERICSSSNGLTSDEASERLERYGPNVLEEKKKTPAIIRFLEQYNSVLIWILIAAAVFSYLIGDTKDAVVIFIVITLNAILGFAQESRGEKAMEALQNLADPRATVIRGGKQTEVRASELVPGDVLVISEGVRIPVDGRVLTANSLKVDESPLTGESKPVRKMPDRVPEKSILSDRTSMVFSGTTVVHGNGEVLITGTGMNTEIGKIATMVQQVEDVDTPLQKRLDTLGKQIAIYAGVICVLVVMIGVIANWPLAGREDWNYWILAGVSMAVAVVPEGLPAIVTVALALGFQEMAKRHAIVRKLNAVETLGSTTVICTDKTGTLTKNEITVKKVILPSGEITVTGSGFDPKGHLKMGDLTDVKRFPNKVRQSVSTLLTIGVCCNNSRLEKEDGMWKIRGDPTEGALLSLARKAGVQATRVRMSNPQVKEIPFDSDRKRMVTVHMKEDGLMVYVKGAPDEIINRSTYYLDGNVERTFSADRKWEYLGKNSDMARNAQRVLAFAYKKLDGELDDYSKEDLEKDLVFVGLTGSVDPPRPEVKDALVSCRKAGIKVIMITGDQPLTAMAVGRSLGMVAEEKNVLTGKELDEISDADFMHMVNDIQIYSRATPAHKMKIVSTLKGQGHVVAMTGDGVNDAPALRQADIGVAMGQKGTDVAREASEITLTDDNFATIVAAVEEGRKIFNNIKRFLRYQLSTNMGAIILIILAVLLSTTYLSKELPLTPAQILYINIIIDGPPAMALAMEPTTSDVMKRKPRKPGEGILDRWMIISVIFLGAVMGLGTLFLYWMYDPRSLDGAELDHAQTVAFTGFVVFQVFNVLNCRSDDRSIFSIGFGTNRYVLAAIGGTLFIHLGVVYLPPIQEFFGTAPLEAMDWLYIFAMASTIIVMNEILVRAKARYADPEEY